MREATGHLGLQVVAVAGGEFGALVARGELGRAADAEVARQLGGVLDVGGRGGGLSVAIKN